MGCALYLAPNILLSPSHGDGGLLLDYVRFMAEGQRPFWDFIDAYGPLNWVPPVLAYRLAGEQVWAVGAAVAAIKLTSVFLCFRLVERLVGAGPAWLAALWMTLLLGAPWQMLQTPYAMHPMLTLQLAVSLLLLAPPRVGGTLPVPSLPRIAAAGLLTGVAIWVKVNGGAFLLAAGLFYCFYWLPPRDACERSGSAPRSIRWAWPVGVFLYAVVFLGFVWPDWVSLFFPYLILPLLVLLGLTSVELWRSSLDRSLALERLGAWSTFLGSTSAVVIGFFLTYFGWAGGMVYLRELGAILTRLQYDSPFPALGEPGLYVGFSEFYWPQLPWLVTLAFLLLCGVRGRLRPGPRPAPHAVLVGLFALFTFGTFVIYSRADEAHLAQGVWPAVPALVVLSTGLWNEIGRPVWPGRLITAGAVGVSLALAVPPNPGSRLGPGEWHSPHLRHLGFHPVSSPYLRNFSPNLTDHDWDVAANEAARHIDRVTEDGAPILLALGNELLPLNSGTRAFGGRHRFLFYLLNNGLITPQSFRELVPPEILKQLAEDPPTVIVTAYGAYPPLFVAVPELQRVFETDYAVAAAYAHIVIYERQATQGGPGSPETPSESPDAVERSATE